MKKIPACRHECNELEHANKLGMSGLQRGAKIMAMPYKKDNVLCSPTSALENAE